VIELAGQGKDSVYTWGDIDYTLPNFVENLYLDVMANDNDGYGNALDNIIVGSIHNNTLDGKAGKDTLEGLWGDDTYYVDNVLDVVIEQAGEGSDTVFSTANYTLSDNIEILSLAGGSAVSGTGNAQSNTIFGNAGDNILDGGGSTDALSGLGGNDTFVFKAGQAHGDTVYEFEGNGAGVGDLLKFVGYGPGATLTQFSAEVWIVASLDGSIQEAITFVGAPALVGQDCVFV
jgi:Ca2+-binding RTX toxin-like protein